VAASSSEGERSNFPQAVNQSIYLMVSVPYATLGVIGFLIYRGCKKNAAFLQRTECFEHADDVPPDNN
jgi:hypothetical protein